MSVEIRHLLFRYSSDNISVRPCTDPVGKEKSIPIYSAARKGNFAVCDLMIGSGFSLSG